LTHNILPDGRELKQFHYGSGQRVQVNFGTRVISESERGVLHREVRRTQGAITSEYRVTELAWNLLIFARITGQLPAHGLLFHTPNDTEVLSRPFVLAAKLLSTDARIDRHALLGHNLQTHC